MLRAKAEDVINKPKIIQPQEPGHVGPEEKGDRTEQLENKLAQINQNVNINIQQPEPAAAPIAGGTRKRRKRKKRRKSSKRR